jgi:hypothetical protein
MPRTHSSVELADCPLVWACLCRTCRATRVSEPARPQRVPRQCRWSGPASAGGRPPDVPVLCRYVRLVAAPHVVPALPAELAGGPRGGGRRGLTTYKFEIPATGRPARTPSPPHTSPAFMPASAGRTNVPTGQSSWGEDRWDVVGVRAITEARPHAREDPAAVDADPESCPVGRVAAPVEWLLPPTLLRILKLMDPSAPSGIRK